jgi:hypothetical protein
MCGRRRFHPAGHQMLRQTIGWIVTMGGTETREASGMGRLNGITLQ